ncbi:NACHT domain-containing protein [Plantactinospora sp. CA-290183]|uniref:NACHT domain-containing protein n=1 Tax=Plantactinospora sp. CA-290183 TaxID=3240006 RepID=UPI003D8BA652
MRSFVYGAGAVIALAMSVWVLRRAEFGDVDPLSAAVGFLSMVAGMAALVVAARTWRWQQTGTADLVVRLAEVVGRAEQQARGQLLGGHDRAIDVEFDFRPAPGHNAAGACGRGRLREVAGYYQRLRPRRMVITGAPGAGKTVLAIELVLALLETRTVDDPVPVRLSAASWDVSVGEDEERAVASQRMERWLVEHLMDTYRLSKWTARALVDAGRILPVIDGLDELDATDMPGYASRAGQALRVFNAYQRYRSKAQLIVTCRSGQYQALTADNTWVEDAARVEIRPVTVAKTQAFITARVVDADRWQTVLDAVKRDRRGPLAAALNTPWRLTLAVAAYEQRGPEGQFLRDPSRLTDPALNTPDEIRDHLLELFIPAALQASPTHPYDPVRAHRWLAVLAGYLDRNAATGRMLGGRVLSGSDIVLHELWPLAGFRRPRLVTLAIPAPIWLVATSILLLTEVTTVLSTHLLAAPVLGLPFWAYASWSTVWPTPQRLHPGRIRTPEGRRKLAIGLAIALVPGLVVGLAFDLVFILLLSLTVNLTVGLTLGLRVKADIGPPNPLSIVWDDLVVGLVFGLLFGLTIGLTYGLETGLVFGLTVGLTFGVRFGLAGYRYIALLLCTRRHSKRWLPWRLGQFLTVCYQAGLVRIAHNGYQFRHRELQDYLTRHPVP